MALRLIEMLIPEDERDEAEELLEEKDSVLDFWYDWVSEKKISIKIIVTVEKSQSVLDELDDNFSHYDGFRMILSPVGAVVPRPEEEEEVAEEEEDEEEGEEESGISREELYEEISNRSEMSKAYLLLMALSAVVAAIGIWSNDIAVIIGAMVIAPMIGPNMGTSLATTLADPQLAKKSVKASLAGIVLVFSISLIIGYFLQLDPSLLSSPQSFVWTRTHPGIKDIALAISAGAAGAVSYTRGVSTALIGVMVSIALLPTLVLTGFLIGSGLFALGMSAMVLFLINIICINLAGVATFLFEGVEPKSWWKADKAKRMSRLAITIWIVLLSILMIIIYLGLA